MVQSPSLPLSATSADAHPDALAQAAGHAGRIGPNAILQVFIALEVSGGKATVERIARHAGLTHHLASPPTAMVDERDVVALHRAVGAQLHPSEADTVMRTAGDMTARYILANRIPVPVRFALKHLPAVIACRLLLRAIARHAWTFAGSGAFAFTTGRPAILSLTDCPACMQVYDADEPCTYYSATLEGLFAALVHPNARIANLPAVNSDGRVRSFRLDW